MNRQVGTHPAIAPSAAAPREQGQGPVRMSVRRVRLGSLARVGFSIGWIISFLPALLASVLVAWILHGIWGTLDGWTPWSPWAPNTRVAGIPMPAPPEFRPREALRVEGFYQMLEPIGRRPVVAVLLGTVALTAIGGGLVAVIMILAGAGYNFFARATGGIEFELAPGRGCRGRPIPHTSAGRERAEGWDWEDADLRW